MYRNCCYIACRFTVVLWLYVVEWCMPGQLCSIMQHLTWDDSYMTPIILVNSQGLS